MTDLQLVFMFVLWRGIKREKLIETLENWDPQSVGLCSRYESTIGFNQILIVRDADTDGDFNVPRAG